MVSTLRAVHDEHYALRRAIVDRAARIDKLSVDRSRFDTMPLPRWSAEAEMREVPLQAARAAVTAADRIAAWRVLFASTGSGVTLGTRGRRA